MAIIETKMAIMNPLFQILIHDDHNENKDGHHGNKNGYHEFIISKFWILRWLNAKTKMANEFKILCTGYHLKAGLIQLPPAP